MSYFKCASKVITFFKIAQFPILAHFFLGGGGFLPLRICSPELLSQFDNCFNKTQKCANVWFVNCNSAEDRTWLLTVKNTQNIQIKTKRAFSVSLYLIFIQITNIFNRFPRWRGYGKHCNSSKGATS